jgi:5-methylcytosine-specific restriction endonuclease McrA
MKAISDKKYADANKEKIEAYRKEHYAEHRDDAIARAKAWAKANPMRRRETANRGRRRRRLDPEYRKKEWAREKKHFPIMRMKLIVLFGSKCVSCGYSEVTEILHFDHKIPVLRATHGITGGGWGMLYEIKKYPEKFQLLCPNCHKWKLYTVDIPYYRSTLSKTTYETFVPHKRWKTWESFEKHRATSLKSTKRRRMKAIILLGGKCQICGWCEHIEILEFDHIIPIFRITSGRGRKATSGSAMVTEVLINPERFQALCPNCHELKRVREDLKKYREVVRKTD